jgi:hypothetical protein
MYLEDNNTFIQTTQKMNGEYGMNYSINAYDTQKLITDKVKMDIERLKERKEELEKIHK